MRCCRSFLQMILTNILMVTLNWRATVRYISTLDTLWHALQWLESAFVKTATVSKLYHLLESASIQNDPRFLWDKGALVWLSKRPFKLNCVTFHPSSMAYKTADWHVGQGELHVKRWPRICSHSPNSAQFWRASHWRRTFHSWSK